MGYQQSAAAYQQLMQLQSQQPYVPVSCEYTSSQNHALADTIYNASTQSNANNFHHPNLYHKTSIIECNMNNVLISSDNENLNDLNTQTTEIDYNNFNHSTIFDADAQIKTPTAQQNLISQTSPSKVTPSNNSEHNMLSKNAVDIDAAASSPDHGDSENALTVQNPKIVGVSGSDETAVASSTSTNENCDGIGQPVSEAALASNCSELPAMQNSIVDDVTQSSLQSPIDENDLNANSFNSAISSPPAASLAAIYTTSSITNNNNSILSRKNSLTTPNHHLLNSSKASVSYTNTPSAKVDTVPDYLSASALSNHPQAALLSAMFYNPPYQQLALTQNLFADSAQMAKEMAQKNYANAFKFALTQQSPGQTAKSPLNAMSYSGMSLSTSNPSMLQPGPSASRLPSSMSPVPRSPFMPALARPMQAPFQQFIRPANLNATNPYFAAAAAHQQFLNHQNMFYPSLSSPLSTQQITTSSGASTPTPYTTSPYPYSVAQAQVMNAQSLQASMMQVPQMNSQPSQTGGSSAVVLNPYKKMKTS